MRGETIHTHIGTLMDIVMDIDENPEIDKADRDLVRYLLSDAITLLNRYE